MLVMKTIFFFLLIIFNSLYLPLFVKKNSEIEGPFFVGKRVEECLEIKKKINCNIKFIESSFFQEKIPEGTILSQYPKPQNLVKSDRIITLTKNTKKQKWILFPDICENRIRNAYVVLKNLELSLNEIIYVEDVTDGVVLRCENLLGEEIKANQKILLGDKVNLVVGLKNPSSLISVPKILKEDLTGIREYLLGIYLDLGEVSYIESGNHTSGDIISQNPTPRKKVSPGTKIYLILAK